MNFQIVTITSQGQVTIPAKLRRILGLDKVKKALVYRQGDKIVMEPVHSITQLAGILKDKKIKNKTIEEIMKLEKNAIETERLKRVLK